MNDAAAVLRASWPRSGVQLMVRYPGQSMEMEMSVGGHRLWSGPWLGEVRRNAAPVPPESRWEAVCRYTDKDVDYLELAIDLAAGLRLERHVVLGRTDRFLLLADAVLGAEPARLQYCGRLPLDPAVTLRRTKRAREGRLFEGKKRLATVLPLALARAQRLAGKRRLDARAPRRLLAALAAGGPRPAAVCAAVVRPGSPPLARPLSWRPLSVGQAMQVQPADVAVGYRIAAGRKQWLVYRSLAKPGNRTLLGHNLTSETLVARFHHNGRVEQLHRGGIECRRSELVSVAEGPKPVGWADRSEPHHRRIRQCRTITSFLTCGASSGRIAPIEARPTQRRRCGPPEG